MSKNKVMLFKFVSVIALVVLSVSVSSNLVIVSDNDVGESYELNKALLSRPLGPSEFPLADLEAVTQGFAAAFKANPTHKSTRTQMRLYSNESDVIRFEILIKNKLKVALSHKIKCFIDYKPVSFSIEEHKVDFLDSTVNPDQSIRLYISLTDPIAKGAHDLLVIGFEQGEHVDDSSRFENSFSHRANVLIDVDEYVDTPYNEIIRNPKESKPSYGMFQNDANNVMVTSPIFRLVNPNDFQLNYSVLFFTEGHNGDIDFVRREFVRVKPNSQYKFEINPSDKGRVRRNRAIIIEQPTIELEMENGDYANKPNKVVFQKAAVR